MRLNIRVKYHPNGTCTISGFPSQHLSSVMTAASLHHYETEDDIKAKRVALLAKKAKAESWLHPVMEDNQADNEVWARSLRRIIDAFKGPAYDHGYRNVPVTKLDQTGRFCRLRDVRDARKGRLAIEAIMEQFRTRTTA